MKRPGDLAMSILASVLDEIVIVTDEEISEAIVLLLERSKLVVEGAGAVGVAALLHGRVAGQGSVGVVLSGGNIDAALLISVMRRGLTLAGRYLNLRTRMPDRPGELAKLVPTCSRRNASTSSRSSTSGKPPTYRSARRASRSPSLTRDD